MDDDRILKIETKIAYQEKTIRELNDELYRQALEIDKLAALCNTLLKQNKALSGIVMGSTGPANEKPPHY